MNICVFCSARHLADKYTGPAKELAKLIAENNHTLVWGGSDSGLMQIMASGVREGGGKLVGVSVKFLHHQTRKDSDEMVIAKDLGERKAMLLKRSDVIVMLVGGTGTLDEATEVIELKKHHFHEKEIIILNTDGFYNGFKLQLETMEKEGLFPCPLAELVLFADTPQAVIDQIHTN